MKFNHLLIPFVGLFCIATGLSLFSGSTANSAIWTGLFRIVLPGLYFAKKSGICLIPSISGYSTTYTLFCSMDWKILLSVKSILVYSQKKAYIVVYSH